MLIHIQTCPGFEEWRNAARRCLQQRLKPNEIQWQVDLPHVPNNVQPSLFAEAGSQLNLLQDNPVASIKKPLSSEMSGSVLEPLEHASPLKIPREFVSQANVVACHSSPDRFALLYRVLWRLLHENRQLLNFQTDDDVIKLNGYAKAVGRDAYKIKAFLRFREIWRDDIQWFVSWYEPEHYTLEMVLPFFTERFANMHWAILTPYRAAYWDRDKVHLEDNPDPANRPNDDQLEGMWLDYYRSIFNPARVKTKAMLNQMPKKYWKNMPETAQIESMLDDAAKLYP